MKRVRRRGGGREGDEVEGRRRGGWERAGCVGRRIDATAARTAGAATAGIMPVRVCPRTGARRGDMSAPPTPTATSCSKVAQGSRESLAAAAASSAEVRGGGGGTNAHIPLVLVARQHTRPAAAPTFPARAYSQSHGLGAISIVSMQRGMVQRRAPSPVLAPPGRRGRPRRPLPGPADQRP